MRTPAHAADDPPRAPRGSCVPNCTAKPKSEKRLYVGDEVDELRDISAVSLRRPVDRGFLVNVPLQKDIWDRTLRRTLKARKPPTRVAGAKPQGVETLFVLTPCAAPAPPQVDPAQCSLLVTEPLFNLPVLMARRGSHGLPWRCTRHALTRPPRCACLSAPQTQFDELIFEQMGFRSALIAPAPALVAHDPLLYGAAGGAAPAEPAAGLLVPPAAALAAAQRSRAMLVLDCGFSYTCVQCAIALLERFTADAIPSPRSHAVPVFDGRVQLAGVRRINIGGKALTNHLKELVSYRCAPCLPCRERLGNRGAPAPMRHALLHASLTLRSPSI